MATRGLISTGMGDGSWHSGITSDIKSYQVMAICLAWCSYLKKCEPYIDMYRTIAMWIYTKQIPIQLGEIHSFLYSTWCSQIHMDIGYIMELQPHQKYSKIRTWYSPGSNMRRANCRFDPLDSQVWWPISLNLKRRDMGIRPVQMCEIVSNLNKWLQNKRSLGPPK